MPIYAPTCDLISRPFWLTADALPGSVQILVKARTADVHGETWTSEATFETTPLGTLDLSQQAPCTGSYEGTDPQGLLWSLLPRAGLTPAFFEMADGGYEVELSCSHQGRVLETVTVRRLGRHPGLGVRAVRERGLYGQLFTPPTEVGVQGACLCLGGSEGGLHEAVAALLASEGLMVLNLAYFGVPGSGLPEGLVNIPLGYFGKALRWLRERPEVAGRQVGVTGASKGAEAALLIGATYPGEVGAVAAIASGGLVFEGIDRARNHPAGQPLSSWSLSGKPLPYIPYRTDWAAFFSGPGPYAMTPIHRQAVGQASPEEVAAATIEAERIAGPVLLVTGGQDAVWNATELSEIVVTRRERRGLPVRHLSHPQAGHGLSLPGLPTYVSFPWTPPGGERQANAHLQLAAWEARLDLLKSVWGAP